jgi:hypothetical protein
MPIELSVWKLGDTPEPISFSPIESEDRLETAIHEDISILDGGLMILGLQVLTDHGNRIDLLCIDSEGDLTVVELKRDRTPREVVAQILDYASWVEGLSYDDVTALYEEHHPDTAFEEAFANRFNSSAPEALNDAHDLVVVASELDPSTERIIDYLSSKYGVPINAVFFRHFQDNGAEYLTRTWLIDPGEVESGEASRSTSKKEPWNERDFYVSFGDGAHRRWTDARRYGFVSAGQGEWYSRTLSRLFEGARIFVNLPGTGYVGVGVVEDEVVPVTEFTVTVDGETMPILEAPLDATKMGENAGDPEKSEYLVGVRWIDTRPESDAVWETGMFANQNTVCKLRNRFTLDRLSEHFDLEE